MSLEKWQKSAEEYQPLPLPLMFARNGGVPQFPDGMESLHRYKVLQLQVLKVTPVNSHTNQGGGVVR